MAIKSFVKESLANPAWWREMTIITIGCIMEKGLGPPWWSSG